jgi:hypothetical protein
VDQLLPPGRLATAIGDVVIAAYVLDLYWLMQEQIQSTGTRCQQGSVSSSDESRFRTAHVGKRPWDAGGGTVG